jgi:phage tail-like protein
MAQNQRSYATARYGLELNGASMGFVESFEGGNATADVVVERPGPDGIARKHLGDVKYEEIVLTCGATMSQPFYDWLVATLNENPRRQNGAVVAYDYNLTEIWRLNFFNSFVSEVGFPALDASSKDAARLCVKLVADYTRRDTTNVGKAAATASVTRERPKIWLPSNFRLNIDGLDCDWVIRIEAITVKQLLTQSSAGAVRNSQLFPSYLQVSNLVITLTESKAADFYDWHQSFVIEGNNGQNQEKNGTLELLSANLKDVLFGLQFNNLGIFRLAMIQASADAVSRIQAEMYCDQVLFTTGASAVATTNAQPGTTSSTQISLPANGGQPGVAGTGMQIQATPKTRAVPISRLPNQVSAGSMTPSQGPRNLNPMQRQPLIPRPPTLRFRNLSSAAEIT